MSARTSSKRNAAGEKRFRAAVARLSDEQLLAELEKANRETGLLRSGRELVAVKDACCGAINLCDERIAALEEQKDELQARIDLCDRQASVIAQDRRALGRELSRVQVEVTHRFGACVRSLNSVAVFL